MNQNHEGWKSRMVNMGEAPEVTIGDMLAFRTLQAGMTTHYTPQPNPAFAQAIDAVTAARQQAGMAPYVTHDGYVPRWQFLPDALEIPTAVTRESINAFLGRSWASRVRRRQRWAGTYVVAKQLRKQGVGLLVARLLLLGRA